MDKDVLPASTSATPLMSDYSQHSRRLSQIFKTLRRMMLKYKRNSVFHGMTRRDFTRLCGASFIMTSARTFAQSGWNPGGIDQTIISGIFDNLGGGYNYTKQGGSITPEGYGDMVANMHMGIIQQMGDNGFYTAFTDDMCERWHAFLLAMWQMLLAF